MTGFVSSSLSLPLQSPTAFSLTQQTSPAASSFNWPMTSILSLERLNSPSQSLLEVRLSAISELEDGWHGLGSMSIDSSVIDRVREAMRLIGQTGSLPEPEVTPTSNGTISLEWENNNVSIYVEIGRTRMNGFIQGHSIGLTVIPEIQTMERDFFRGLVP